jgi:hypothetical protein
MQPHKPAWEGPTPKLTIQHAQLCQPETCRQINPAIKRSSLACLRALQPVSSICLRCSGSAQSEQALSVTRSRHLHALSSPHTCSSRPRLAQTDLTPLFRPGQTGNSTQGRSHNPSATNPTSSGQASRQIAWWSCKPALDCIAHT